MLRLALLATAISLANAASGTGYTLFQIKDAATTNATTYAEDKAACAGAVASTGTASAGPSFAAEVTNKAVFQSKVFIMDECYNLHASSYLPMGVYNTVALQHSLINADTAAILSVKVVKGTNDEVGLASYTDVDCATASANSPQEPKDEPAGAAVGFQCSATAGSLTTGYAVLDNSAANDYVNTSAGFRAMNYLKLEQYTDTQATSPAVQTCATVDTANDGTEKFYTQVMADDTAAHAAAIGTWKIRETIGCYVESQLHFNGASGTKSYQTLCDKETGDIVYNHYNAADNCSGATDVQLRFNNNVGCTESSSGVNWKFATGATFRSMCASPASTATAKWFTGYLADDAAHCAALDNSGTITASHVNGTKAVIIGVCYTGEHAHGRLAGFQGPFSAGTANTEPIAVTPRTGGTNPTGDNAGGSFMFTEESSGHIGVMQYATPDCSSTTATTATFVTDDPAGPNATDWACDAASTNFLTHGGVATTGNVAQLQTATNYLTVRAHGDQTTGDHNMGGKCHGVNVPPSGQRVDHFVLDQCMQSATAASYKFKCESAGPTFTNATDGNYYAISYDEYGAADCSGTPTAAKFLYFTQTSFNSAAITATGLTATAALSDTAAEWALNEMDCGACSTATAKSEAACLALGTPGTWTAGTCTDAHGAAGEWGGKCLQVGSDAADGATWNSWEIMTDNATWAAMCGPATPAPASSTTSTSGAGKIAATAAAAAAATAALLL